MASVIIPASRNGSQRFGFVCQLDGINFRFDFDWNWVRSFWSFILSDSIGNLLITRRIVADSPMISKFIGVEGFPFGDIIAIDTSGKGQDPGLNDLNDRVQLLYLSVKDIVVPP